MSTATTQPGVKEAADQAKAAFAQAIMIPVFLETLQKEAGITPANDLQRQHLIRIGTRLLQAEAMQAEKAAADGSDVLAQAEADLDRVLAGIYNAAPHQEVQRKQAAYNIAAANPDVVNWAKAIEASYAA